MTSKLSLPPAPTDQGQTLYQIDNNSSSSFEVANKTNTVSIEKLCNVCNTPNSRNRCSRCKIYYCTAECQKKDWESGHQSACQEALNSVIEKKHPSPSDVLEGFREKVDVITTTVSSLPFQYFSIKETGRSYGLHFWADCVSTIGQSIAQEVMKSLPKSSKKVFEVDSNLFLAKLPAAMGKVAIELQKRNIPNYSIQLRNVESILHTEFSDNMFEIDSSSSETCKNSWDAILLSISLWGYYESTKIDPTYRPSSVTFSRYAEESFQKLSPNAPSLSSLHTNMSCFSYAFLKTDRIDDILYWYKVHKAAWVKELYNMGYENVLTAQNGDFIFYFMSKDEPPTHAGIWREPGLVESKPGNINSHVFTLDLLDSPEIYGRNFAIFRKSSHKTTTHKTT